MSDLRCIGQSIGPFLLPCHKDEDYAGGGKSENLDIVRQCAGAAIYRSNIGVAERFPAAFHHLPENHELVFSKPAEMIAKFREISVTSAEEVLKNEPPELLLQKELNDAGVKHL